MAGAFILVWRMAKSNGRSILQREFAAVHDPGGPYTACKVRFPIEEMSTPVIVRVTLAGWYMVSPPEEVAKWSWTNNVPYLREPVFISWSQLQYAPANFPMSRWIRFDVVGTKVLFFVRKDVALPLLREAGRPLSAK